MTVQHTEIAIVGAGPAGLMAAIEAARGGCQVVVLEAEATPARKLLASGGGRCNLTNTLTVSDMAQRFGQNPRFVEAVLRRFGPDDLRRWFADVGVETHAPDGFRVFPTTHNSSTVVDALLVEVRRLGIRLQCSWPVNGVKFGEMFLLAGPAGSMKANRVVITVGGVGYPGLGDGRGMWSILDALGHTIAPPVPAMVPLVTMEDWPSRCRADTLPGVELSLAGKKKPDWTGDLIFTRSGIAGPVVLDAAGELATRLQQQGNLDVRIRLRQGGAERWRKILASGVGGSSGMLAVEFLSGEIASSLAVVALEEAGIEPGIKMGGLAKQRLNALAQWLGSIPLTVTGTEGFPKAMVTRGGVAPRELTASLESRKVPGLYLAGEVIDVDGPCGGFNLQWAFSSGYTVGWGLR